MNAMKECVAESRTVDSVKNFIKCYKKFLNKDQIRLLNLMQKKVNGFYLHSTEVHSNNHEHFTTYKNLSHLSIFKFHIDGVDGEIIIRF